MNLATHQGAPSVAVGDRVGGLTLLSGTHALGQVEVAWVFTYSSRSALTALAIAPKGPKARH